MGEYKLYEIVGMDPIRDHYVFIILMSGILFILALQYPYFGKGSVVAIATIIVFVCTIVVATYIINMYKLLSKKCVTI